MGIEIKTKHDWPKIVHKGAVKAQKGASKTGRFIWHKAKLPPKVIVLSLIAFVIVAGCPYFLTHLSSDDSFSVDDQIPISDCKLTAYKVFTYTSSNSYAEDNTTTTLSLINIYDPSVTNIGYLVDSNYVLPSDSTFRGYAFTLLFDGEIPSSFTLNLSNIPYSVHMVISYIGGMAVNHQLTFDDNGHLEYTFTDIEYFKMNSISTPTVNIQIYCYSGQSTVLSDFTLDFQFYSSDSYNYSPILLFVCGILLVIFAVFATNKVNFKKDSDYKEYKGRNGDGQ